MAKIKVIEGEIFRDERGQISSLNDFRFGEVKRTYFIHQTDINIIRGWHGHQREKKWFYCIKGSFTLALVKIDNWEIPSPNLIPEVFHLSDQQSKIICVPEGYANCIKAGSPDSILQVFSCNLLEDALNDSWRYDKHLWVDWSIY